MQKALQDVLARRRDRSIAIVLGVKERECDRDLSAASSQKLRKVVLDQFNEFYELVSDIMTSLDSGEVVLNEGWLDKLDQIYSTVVLEGRRGT